jgi:hypothetical protein
MAAEKKIVRVSLEEVALAALKSKGIESGLWRLAVGMRFSALTMEWQEQDSKSKDTLPSAIVGITDLALIEEERPGNLIFDAAAMRLASDSEAAVSQARAPARTKAPKAAAKRSLPKKGS